MGSKDKKIFFLINKDVDFSLKPLCDEYLPGVTVDVAAQLPANTDEYALVIPWNYYRLIPAKDLRPNFMVFHPTDLPQGKGWAPLYYTMAQKKEFYTLTGFVPDDSVDGGDVVVKARFRIQPNYTASILRRHHEKICLIILRDILNHFDGKPPLGKKQEDSVTPVYKRRWPQDNELDTTKALQDLIPHLRACEPQHPAFFWHQGEKFIVTITPEKEPKFPEDLEIEFFYPSQKEPT